MTNGYEMPAPRGWRRYRPGARYLRRLGSPVSVVLRVDHEVTGKPAYHRAGPPKQMSNKIADVTSFALGAGRGNVILVRIRTDDGLQGIGEGTINYRVRAIHGAIEDFAMYLVGKDARQIERHWQALYRNSFFRGGPIQMTALSAIEQALWDIRGKQLGVPVWDLLGGAARDRIAVYTHGGGGSPEVAAERCVKLVEEGLPRH